MLTRVHCSECGGGLTSQFLPVGELVVSGYTLCPECLEAIPDEVANAFLGAAKAAGAKVRAARPQLEAPHEHAYAGRDDGYRCACGVVRPDRDDLPPNSPRRQ